MRTVFILLEMTLKLYEKPFTMNAPVADVTSRTVRVKEFVGARSE